MCGGSDAHESEDATDKTAHPPNDEVNPPTSEPPTAQSDVPGFDRFWQAWPAASGRKQARGTCLSHWIANGLEADQHLIVAHVEAMKRTQHWKTGGDPTPIRYLEGRRWRDCSPEEIEVSVAAAQQPGDDTPWHETMDGVDARGKQLGVRERKPDENWRYYRVLVANAARERGAVEAVLNDARRFNDSQLYQFARTTFGDALMPVDDYAS